MPLAKIDTTDVHQTQNRLAHFILICSLALYWAVVALLFFQCKQANAGHFVYPLDDTYIHLSIAKNLAFHGVWGVTRFAFGSSSSSILWPLILAGVMKATGGPRELAPLALCIVAGSLLLWSISCICRRERVPPIFVVVLMAGVIVLTPLAPLTMTGMEHVCQTLIDLWCLYIFAKTATSSGKAPARLVMILIFLSVLTTMVRYEGLFLILIGALALLVKRKWALAIFATVAGIVPLVVFGAISARHGSFWIPNSVILKGHPPAIHSFYDIGRTFGLEGLRKLFDAPWMIGLIVGSLCMLALGHRRASILSTIARTARVALVIAFGVAILHFQYAAIGWFFRYESYLIVLLFFCITLSLSAADIPIGSARTPREAFVAIVIAIIAMIAGYPLADRAMNAHLFVPVASHNIYEQQYMMAQFVHDCCPCGRVAVNDIGAVAFFNDIQILDIFGLDDPEILRQKMNRAYSSRSVAAMAVRKELDLAIVYDKLFENRGGTPPAWTRIGTWHQTDDYICAGDTITFFSLNPQLTEELRERLRIFSEKLPKTTIFTPY